MKSLSIHRSLWSHSTLFVPFCFFFYSCWFVCSFYSFFCFLNSLFPLLSSFSLPICFLAFLLILFFVCHIRFVSCRFILSLKEVLFYRLCNYYWGWIVMIILRVLLFHFLPSFFYFMCFSFVYLFVLHIISYTYITSSYNVSEV